MHYLTAVLILALRQAQLRMTYLALGYNCHLFVEWGSVEFRAQDNPKQWVNDYNRKIINLPAMGGGMRRVFNICYITFLGR
jgi:hypothetical protein